MKKSVILFSALAASMIPFSASAAEQTADIHISITMDSEVLDTDLNVQDQDGDGKLTYEDALYAAHEQFYPGGAAAGYGDGLIWGRQCSGGYTLYNQDELPLDTTLPYTGRLEIRDGDTMNWSAQYIMPEMYLFGSEYLSDHFMEDTVPSGTEIDVYVDHMIPTEREPGKAEGIELLVDGQRTGIRTAADGKAALKITEPGKHKVTADLSHLTAYNRENEVYMEFTVAAAETEAAETDTAPAAVTAAAETVTAAKTEVSVSEAAPETENTEAPVSAAETEAETVAENVTAETEAETTAESVSAETAAAKTTAAETTAASTERKSSGTQTAAPAANAPAAQRGTAQSKGVQTGDTMPIAALAIAGLAAAVGAVLLFRRKH